MKPRLWTCARARARRASSGPRTGPAVLFFREAALALVERLELDSYHYLHATRAELLCRLDRVEDARASYDRALKLVHSDAERRFLERRLAELS
jgi:predicted RNA polymerase sigma factor